MRAAAAPSPVAGSGASARLRSWLASAAERLPRPRDERAVHPADPVLAAAVTALVGFGVVMVYSASAFEATVRFGDAQHYLKRQVSYAGAGLATMWLVSHVDYRRLRPFTYPALFLVGAMMVATVAGWGHEAGNAFRWLAVGPIHIQPSEAAKVAMVLWLAYSLSKKAQKIRTFSVGFLPHLLVVGLFMALCMRQPDFGSAVVLLFLTFTMLFVAGVRLGYIVSFSALLGLMAAAAVRFSGYRYARYLSWLDMEGNRQGLAYQPFQSVMSFGSGGVLGLGLGRGLQVLYLPEAHTDFIAAIVGEELGFVGICGLCAVFLLIVARAVKIALMAEDDYGSYLAFGLAAMFGMQVLINLAVAMAIIPTKGMTLPFVSYGGSSLLVNLGAAGILLNVSRARPRVAAAATAAAADGPAPSASAVVATAAQEGQG
ncbi:MAG: putative lipid II flippase FtsW [Deltaproteobacteria bacterium]|nr:putative lipid II flippase FtsW [Deltaproteobacteria bacterium]